MSFYCGLFYLFQKLHIDDAIRQFNCLDKNVKIKQSIIFWLTLLNGICAFGLYHLAIYIFYRISNVLLVVVHYSIFSVLWK